MDAKIFDSFVRATRDAQPMVDAPARKRKSARITTSPTVRVPASAPIPESEQTNGSPKPKGRASTLTLDDGDRVSVETQKLDVAVVEELILLWRMRQRWHRAEKSLILQGKAICRGICNGDKKAGSALFERARDGEPVDPIVAISLSPFLLALRQADSRDPGFGRGFQDERERLEKQIRDLARKLPIWKGWGKDIHGLGELGIAGIVGSVCVREGDEDHVTVRMLGDYRSVSALWKRMGLAVIDGKRQRKCVDEDEALLHGYSPTRRSVMWNVGASLIGGMGRGPRPRVGEDMNAREDLSPWQKLFVERLRYLAERDPDEYAREPVTSERTGEVMESFSAHAAASAKRYVEKRFLREMWSAWREQDRQTAPVMKPSDRMSADASEAALRAQPKHRPPRSRTNSNRQAAWSTHPREDTPAAATETTGPSQPNHRTPRSRTNSKNSAGRSTIAAHEGHACRRRPGPWAVRNPRIRRLGRHPITKTTGQGSGETHACIACRSRERGLFACATQGTAASLAGLFNETADRARDVTQVRDVCRPCDRGQFASATHGPGVSVAGPLSESTMTDIGTTPRKPLSPTQRLKLFEAHRGICALCSRPIRGEPWRDEHLRALGLGGGNEVENRAPVHIACAEAKDSDDLPRIAKAKRQKMAHLGIKKSSRPIPGSRASGFKKHLDGRVTRR